MALPFNSISQLHRHTAQQRGRGVAIRVPKWGRYVDYTWNEYRQQSDDIANALLQLGIEPGERVAILSENRLEWLVTDQAIFSTGAVTVPLHTSLAVDQVIWQLNHSESAWLFVSGSQLAKIDGRLSDIPSLRGVVCYDRIAQPSGEAQRPPFYKWSYFRHVVARRDNGKRPTLEEREASISPDDLATIIYTSGTTGEPKGVMLSHGNLVSNAVSRQQVARYRSEDIKLSWLPYSHAYARTVDCYMSAYVGMTVVLARSPQTLREDLRRAEPTWMTGVPRFYEKVWRELKPLGQADRHQRLSEIFGRRIRAVSCGGAPIDPEIVAGFSEAGLPLLVGYGLTETSPVLTLNTETSNKLGTVGKPLPGAEVKISAAGEVLTRGPQVMQGYWKDPVGTSEVLQDGWFRTGDLGSIDEEGYLTIEGRIKDLIVTSQGKNVAPIPLEQRLAADPAMEQVVIHGDGKAFLTAVVVPDFAYLRSQLGLIPPDHSDETSIWNDLRLQQELEKRIRESLRSVSEEEQVRRFIVLSRSFSVEKGELTPSFKVRRQVVLARFESQLNELYV